MGFDLRTLLAAQPYARVRTSPVVLIVALATMAMLTVAPAAALPALASDGLFGMNEEDLFVTNDDDLFGWGEDDLFGGDDLLVETMSSDRDKSLADELLVSDGIEFGGSYNVGLNSSSTRTGSGEGKFGFGKVSSQVELGGNVYADMRPSKDFRLFAKARVDGGGPVDDLGRLKLTPKLTEAFADFHSNNRVFFRAGKQMINWGVGYFFSPADIVNIGRIDPENPEADREGPVALKATMPVGSDNYYVHVIADSVTGGTRFALAPKAEWVVGGTELGLGAYYREDRAPRGMMTVTGSLGRVSVFGEGVLSYGSDKRFLQADADAPFGARAVRKDDHLFVHVTVGMRHSWNDPDGRYNVMGAAQYYYNGEGYPAGVFEDLFGNLLENDAQGLKYLMATGEWSPADIGMYPGRHYAALSLNWMEAFGSRFSPGLFWLGNLQDNSGMVSASLGIKTWEKLRLSLGASHTYGAEHSEYARFGTGTTVFVNLSSGGSF